MEQNLNGNGRNGHEKNNTKEHRAHDARQRVVESIQTRLNDRRTFGEKFADGIVLWFGTFSFCLAHILFFTGWILINLGVVRAVPVFDPYPFNLLTMTVSLEAIFLSIFVLINQNRASKIADLRQEFDLQVNMIAEREITKIIHLIAYLMNHLRVPYQKDPELKHMMRPLDTDEMRDELERQLNLPRQKPSNINF